MPDSLTRRLRPVPDTASAEVLDRLFNALWREGLAATRRLWHRGGPSGIAVVRLAGGGLMAAGVRDLHALDRPRTCPPYAVDGPEGWRTVASAGEAAAALAALEPLASELAQSERNMRSFLSAAASRAARLPAPGGLLARVFADASELDVAPEAFLEGWIAKGHPLHPGAKMRLGMDDGDLARYSPELGRTVPLRFVALARTHCVSRRVPGPEAELPWAQELHAAMGGLQDSHIPLAVHPWQAEHVLPRVFERELSDGVLRVLDLERPARPLVSVRTLVPVDRRGACHLKLPVALQMTSALRTVSAQSAENGPALSAWLEPIVASLPRLTLQCERLGRHFWSPGADPHDGEALERARHLSMLLRDAPQPLPGTWLVPAALLTETCPLIHRPLAAELLAISGLPPRAWVAAYADLLAGTLIPLLLRHGVAAEAHSQNTVVRFAGGRPLELLLRDLGGIRAWRPWMEGAPDLHPASVITAGSLDELIAKAHHTWLQGNLAPLLTALADATGAHEPDLWKPVGNAFRQAFEREPGERARQAAARFLAPRIQVKALTRMRLGGRSHHYDFCEVDNPLV